MQPTFKSMRRDGAIKRGEANAVRLEDIHIEPGHNERDHDEAFWQSVDELVGFLEAGGVVPPLEVRPRPEGGVWLVDGERRTWSFRKMDERGTLPRTPAKDTNKARDTFDAWIDVIPFKANDAERVLRIATSNTNKPLTAQELGRVYKRLIGFKWTPAQIAKASGKTVATVQRILDLADGNTDVQQMVKAGEVMPTLAAETVRKHGDAAGAVLQQALVVAKANGKTKVTNAVLKPKRIPEALVERLIASLRECVKDVEGALPEADLLHRVEAVLKEIDAVRA